MNKFEKITVAQFTEDFKDFITDYEAIQLPIRKTKRAMGYDFIAPFSFSLSPGESITIPTGVRIKLDDDKGLFIVPRSGLGFKYRCQLDNTIGVVDADYYDSSNEGHIMIKLTNDTHENKAFAIEKGQGFAQGIILQYFVTEDDAEIEKAERDGGFGSTDKMEKSE